MIGTAIVTRRGVQDHDEGLTAMADERTIKGVLSSEHKGGRAMTEAEAAPPDTRAAREAATR